MLVILFNKPLYLLLKEEENHFAYKYHFSQEIANILKNNHINAITTNDKELSLRLKYYGIEEDKSHFVSLTPLNLYDKRFDIIYLNKNILSVYYVNLDMQEK